MDIGSVVVSLTLARFQDGGAPSGPAVPGGVPGAPGTTGAPLPPPGTPGPTGGGGLGFFLPLIMVLIVFMLLTSMAGRKERKRRAAILAGVKRGDRVQTVGGEIGTVVELTESEMVLRVDEVSNTRIRFARSAIQQVIKEGREAKDSSVPAKAEATPAR
jgi:preprotein translocase subunit YajC